MNIFYNLNSNQKDEVAEKIFSIFFILKSQQTTNYHETHRLNLTILKSVNKIILHHKIRGELLEKLANLFLNSYIIPKFFTSDIKVHINEDSFDFINSILQDSDEIRNFVITVK